VQATIQETLRLRPVISIVLRRPQEPMELGGRLLPAGASIVPSIHLVHRRADIYPEPAEFRPERFIEAEGGRSPGTYTWIPFGGGIRRCLGAAFAQFEMEVVLRELVLRRTLAPSRPGSERVYRRAITETPRHDAEVLVGRCPVAGTPTGDVAPGSGASAQVPAGTGHGGGDSLDARTDAAVGAGIETQPEATPA
jgi:cytochrome P450